MDKECLTRDFRIFKISDDESYTTIHQVDCNFIDIDEDNKVAEVKLYMVYPSSYDKDTMYEDMDAVDADLDLYGSYIRSEIKENYDTYVIIQRLYVEDKYRKNGIGSYILDNITSLLLDINPLLDGDSVRIVGIIVPDKDKYYKDNMKDVMTQLFKSKDYKVVDFGNNTVFDKDVFVGVDN